MFRGTNLGRLIALALIATVVAVSGASAATNLTEPTGPKWVDGTPLLADLTESYLAKAAAMGIEPLSQPAKEPKGVRVGDQETFWSIDMTANQPFQLQAVLRKISTHAYFYVQEGFEVSEATLERMAGQFDDVIYPTNHTYFGEEEIPGIDADARITLLLMDIQDGWEPGRGYVAGYFFPLDGFSTRLFPQSNERQMFYLDLKPGDPTREDYLGVLAHEFQHMIHFNHDPREPKWINESLAQLAFFVNGYGHAPQIFTYIRDTNSTFDRFDNTLEDYGRSYLFIYYLFSKYGGSTDAERQAFVRELVSSKQTGQESIAGLLKSRGVEKSLEEIKLDWLVANAANAGNGVHGYDDSIRFHVQSSQVYTLAGMPTKSVKDVVSPDAARYITFAGKVNYTPDHPTMVDRVKIYSEQPGTIVWTVNGGEMPPARLIPDGSSTTQDQTVVTPLALEGERYFAEIGPFSRLGTVIRKIDYRFQYHGGASTEPAEVPIFSLASLAQAAPAADASFRFRFDGENPGMIGAKAKFKLFAVRFGKDGSVAVEDVHLDDGNEGIFNFSLDSDEKVTFVVNALSGSKKGVKFSYKVERRKGDELAELIEAGARLAGIDQRTDAADVAESRAGRTFYRDLSKAKDRNLRALASLLASDDDAGTRAAEIVASAGDSEKGAMADLLKKALKRARFDALEDGTVSEALKADILGVQTMMGEDEDDSHDNVGYLINKKNEIVHALTHLQIDPQFLEGQILKLWRLLEIARGFPHLPLPDGFGIVDYDEQGAKDLLAQWAQDFGVSLEGLEAPETRPVELTADEQRVKHVLRRLILAESLIEFAYNNGLTLAGDTAVSMYDFARLILAGYSTVSDIAKHFQNVPIIGPIAKALKQRILSRVLGLGEKFAIFLTSRMKPPVSQYGPIAVSVIVYVAARVLDVNVDRDNPNFWKALGVNLMGRYAFTSIPKVGFVARSQAAVDLATEYAAGLTANGTLEDAERRVWDDGSSQTEDSVREVIAAQVTKRAATAAKDRDRASTAKQISRILAYASLLDPTNITRVLSILSAATSGGFLAHGTWTTASYYFKLPKNDMIQGVRLAYDPAAAAAGEDEQPMRLGKVNPAFNQKLLGELEASYEIFQRRAAEALAAARGKASDLEARVDAMLKADEDVQLASQKAEALALSGSTGDEAAVSEARSLYTAAQGELMRRAMVLADVFGQVAGDSEVDSAALAQGAGDYLAALRTSFTKLASDGEEAPVAVLVSRSDAERDGDEIEVTAMLSNLSSEDVQNVRVQMMSGLDFAITSGEKVQTIPNLRAGRDVRVRWTIRLNEAKLVLGANLAIVAEADGVNVLPKLQGLPN